MSDPAPAAYVYCPHCGTPLETRLVTDKPRRACPSCNFIYFTDPKVGVGTLVLKDGKILLVRRRMMPEAGKWSIPAGYLDRGEDPRDVAARETWEETGLEVTIGDLLDVYYNACTGNSGASIFILYRAELIGGELQAGDDADAAAFFEPGELPELAFASTRDAIRWLQDEHSE